MTCQALEAQQKGLHAVGQLHTAMNQSQTAPLDSSDCYNDKLTADSSCIMVKTNCEQSTDKFFKSVSNVILCEYR